MKQACEKTSAIHIPAIYYPSLGVSRNLCPAFRIQFYYMNKKTQIAFTCHDLRRLKAQLARRNESNAGAAGIAIGDSTESVVTTHYAPDTIETQRKNKLFYFFHC